MTTMIAEVYKAFIEAGVSEETARSAAESLANYEDRFNRNDLDHAEMKADLKLLKWMLGLLLASVLSLVIKAFFI